MHLKRSLNLLSFIVAFGIGVILIFNLHLYGSEKEKLYFATEPAGDDYSDLVIVADVVGSSYLFELSLRAAVNELRLETGLHHGVTLILVYLVRNAVEFEFAPQFYASIGATLFLHVVADFPVIGSFLLRECANKQSWRRRFSAMLAITGILKFFAHTAINLTSVILYLDINRDATFHLRQVSASAWAKVPYNMNRRSYMDTHLQIEWTEIIRIVLPILVVALFVVQIWATIILIRIGLRGMVPKIPPPDLDEDPIDSLTLASV